MNRRQFFRRMAAAVGVVVVAPAIPLATASPVVATSTAELMGPFKFHGIPVETSEFMGQDYILFCSPQVKTAYEDLVRSDVPFWRSQR